MRNVKKTSALALATLILSAAGALAADGVATGTVNVRTGPGSSYNKVDTLHAGEEVDIGQCQSGWCYIEHSGPDGWVSANYLSPGGGSNSGSGGSGDDCHVNWVVGHGFTLECNGNSITVPGPGLPPPPPPPTPTICIYDGANYTGAHLCGPAGTSNSMLVGFWNDRISSLKISGGAHVKLCQNPNYLGFCNTFSSDIPMLGGPLNNKASSYQSW
jgi:hypothetical protein